MDDITVTLHSQGIRRYLSNYRLQSTQHVADVDLFLAACLSHLETLIRNLLSQHLGLKFQLLLNVTFVQPNNSDTINLYFVSKQATMVRGEQDLISLVNEAYSQLKRQVDEFLQRKSGWVLEEVNFMDCKLSKYNPLVGSSYIQLPKTLASKKAIVNVKNNDAKCFLWSVLAALYPQERNAERVWKYTKFEKQVNCSDISFPVSVENVTKFEMLNSLAINVYGYRNEKLHPLYISAHKEFKRINLLLLTEGSRQHYCLIKNLDRLLFSLRKDNRKKFFCENCFASFTTKANRDSHFARCDETTEVEMPEETELAFKNWNRKFPMPYVIYADFECLLMKVESCKPSVERSFTERTQHHVPCGYALCGVYQCCDGQVYYEEPEVYRGEDCVRRFLECVITHGEWHQVRVDNAQDMIMTPEHWCEFNNAATCHICGKDFECDDEENEKVRDHCHMCGEFRGAAHSRCNITFRQTREIVVYFHNLRRYDGHLIMRQLGVLASEMHLDIECVPRGIEDYLTFSLLCKRKHGFALKGNGKPVNTPWRIRFVDSYQFLTSSLDGLVNNLYENGKGKVHFKAMASHFNENVDLLLRKGVYPYDYVDSWSRFEETQLPPAEAFYSALTKESISAEAYSYAQKVWNEMNLKNVGEYHDLYLLTDVLLLVDVFESFRRAALKHYGIDPAHYLTLPSYGWDACLKLSEVTLELLQDADMYKFFERGIRGGVCMISHRYAEANNPLTQQYNDEKPPTWLLYLDANNLYGYAMSQYLPSRDFEWVCELEQIDYMNTADDAETGFVLEVDMDYPAELHDTHNSYPLAPEPMEITEDMVSPYCHDLIEKLRLSGAVVQKLVPNLKRKEHYVVHYRNLKLYVSLGLQVTKVHRAVSFTQTPWMKSYIDLNTGLRKKARSDFEKDLFKLMNNAVFGKSMENVRNYRDIKLVSTEKKIKKLVSNPRYVSFHLFNEHLAAVELKRESVILNKPIYNGIAVLDLSKWLMYDFHYNYMLKKYGYERVTLCFTDTDSLFYLVQTGNIYEDMKADLQLFDTSDYPVTHALHSDVNKKIIGKMKDETHGAPIEAFVGLRAKMYAFKYTNNGQDEEKKRAKGISRTVVKKEVTFDMYKSTLEQQTVTRHVQMRFANKDHEIYTAVQNKIGLSAYDDKRYILDDGITTLAHGHYSIVKT